jgi:hypothetical protein
MSDELGWVWVSLPWATFGLAVRDGVVVDAAPIARWTIGKPELDVAAYWRRRGAVFARLR